MQIGFYGLPWQRLFVRQHNKRAMKQILCKNHAGKLDVVLIQPIFCGLAVTAVKEQRRCKLHPEPILKQLHHLFLDSHSTITTTELDQHALGTGLEPNMHKLGFSEL